MSSSVVDFYEGLCVLVTGASGFLGKALLEKLLRSVSGIKTIFLLIRPHKGHSAQVRLTHILSSPIFDKIKSQCPKNLEKICVICGNIMEPELGISANDVEILTQTVSVVFHCAATIKFDEALIRTSVRMNVMGTKRVASLCKKMPHLLVLVHVSTAYANADRDQVAESVYTPPCDPDKLIQSISWMDEEMLNAITPHLIGKRPNTYTLTKALAEHSLLQESKHIPICIVRPSIIGASWKEPLVGWTDNFNGPTGLFIAVGKGLLRKMHGDRSGRADIVPVDVVVNLLIVAAQHTATRPTGDEVVVVNCCSGGVNPVSWGVVEESFGFFHNSPFKDVFRSAKRRPFTHSRRRRLLMTQVDELIPAHLVDFGRRLVGKKPKLRILYRKLLKAVDAMEYFTTREWDFESKTFLSLLDTLSSQDKQTLDFDLREIKWDKYLESYHKGLKKYILKEE